MPTKVLLRLPGFWTPGLSGDVAAHAVAGGCAGGRWQPVPRSAASIEWAAICRARRPRPSGRGRRASIEWAPPAHVAGARRAALGVDADAPAFEGDAGGRPGVERLADGLEHHVGLGDPGLAGLDQAAAVVAHAREGGAADPVVPACSFFSTLKVRDQHAVVLGPGLFVPEAGIWAWPRRYTIVTSSAPSLRDCTAASTAVMPPPMTSTRRPTGSVAEVARLAQAGDEVDRVLSPSCSPSSPSAR